MRVFAVILVSALATGAAHAEGIAPPTPEPGRYAMTPTEGGFLRLDTQSGAVSLCTVKEGLSLCRASAEERATLEAEVSRLTKENAELKSRLAANPPPPAQQRSSSNVPSEEEFERTLSFTEKFLRRMMRILREEAPADRSCEASSAGAAK